MIYIYIGYKLRTSPWREGLALRQFPPRQRGLSYGQLDPDRGDRCPPPSPAPGAHAARSNSTSDCRPAVATHLRPLLNPARPYEQSEVFIVQQSATATRLLLNPARPTSRIQTADFPMEGGIRQPLERMQLGPTAPQTASKPSKAHEQRSPPVLEAPGGRQAHPGAAAPPPLAPLIVPGPWVTCTPRTQGPIPLDVGPQEGFALRQFPPRQRGLSYGQLDPDRGDRCPPPSPAPGAHAARSNSTSDCRPAVATHLRPLLNPARPTSRIQTADFPMEGRIRQPLERMQLGPTAPQTASKPSKAHEQVQSLSLNVR
ncbi:hypothetical protein SKAU_G00355720 [Synaphobranchus kaupii]|uniref:Uncharacterized protein n=1 Tax=Synaphobranchus kaupii TaxID=118154 RepID=A0A9Q1EH88_SYNKA|nr:hypothetical protein SKAU_G00355720 [Synaphobranchus kaupii]